jgi:D-alanine-D-alanine ligase
VSCVSALNVVQAVDPARYDLRLVGITTDGRWVDATHAAGRLAAGATALPAPEDVRESAGDHALLPTEVVADPAEGTVVVLPLLHGPMGEDGTVQGLLELAGVAYAGAGVTGSAAAMDKGVSKGLLAAVGLPQVRYLGVTDRDVDDLLAKRVEADLGWPVFVKPANLGSTIGVSKVTAASALPEAVALALRFDEYALIEEAVTAREIEVGVLGWPDLRASVPGEVRPSHEFYDFEDKYLTGAAQLIVPAQLEPSVARRVQSLAVDACRALRVDGMARVDFFVEEGGRGALVNEVNTIPGFTPGSMFPMLWAASGVPYATLVDQLVDQALRRYARRSRIEVFRP